MGAWLFGIPQEGAPGPGDGAWASFGAGEPHPCATMDLVEMTQEEWHLCGFGEHRDLGFGRTQKSGGLFLLTVSGVQQCLHPFWPSEPRKRGHSPGRACGGLGHAGPGLQAALEPFPAFLASPGKAAVGGEGGAGRGGSECDPWPCLALSRSRLLAEGDGGRGWLLLGKKGLFYPKSGAARAVLGLLLGQEGPGDSGMPRVIGQG